MRVRENNMEQWKKKLGCMIFKVLSLREQREISAVKGRCRDM